MLLNKMLKKIMKICVLEDFSKFEVKFVTICKKSYRIYHTSTQYAVFSNRNIDLKRIPKF